MSDEPQCDKVVPMRGGELIIQKAPRFHREYCMNNCKRITVDGEKRTVTCNDCKQDVDPFDYILFWANEGDSRMSILKKLDADIAVKGNEMGALKREYENLRVRFDKIDKPLRKQIEQDFFNAQHNPHIPFRVVKDFKKAG